jgi:hypothetical protein
MKNFFRLLFALIVLAATTSVDAQTSFLTTPTTYDLYQPVTSTMTQPAVVYSHTNGIQNITPSYEISNSIWGNGYSVYNYSNGVRDILPSYEFRSTAPGVYNGYGTTNGITNITPSTTIYVPQPYTPVITNYFSPLY